MINNVELTPAELEMIKVKREQEALAKKEAEAKQAIQLEKDIKKREELIIQEQKKDQMQLEAANTYAAELGSMYTVKTEERTSTAKISGDYLNPSNPKECDYKRVVLWSKEYTRKSAWIVRGEYKILIEEHTTFSSRYDYRGTSQGFKMSITGPGIDFNNRKYSRASKVNEIIQNAISDVEQKAKAKEQKANALNNVKQRMKQTYPTAKIDESYDYERSYKSLGDRYDTLILTFENGICVTYRVFSDGSLSRLNITFPKQKDAWSLMELLSKITFPLDN